jgi:hypothetical protein
VRAQVVAQPEHLAVAGALEHELDAQVRPRRGVERPHECDCDRDTARVIGGGRAVGCASELEQRGEREHQRHAGHELEHGERRRVGVPAAHDRDHYQPRHRQRKPAEPSRRERAVGGGAARAGADASQRGGVDEAGAARVVGRGDEQPHTVGRGICGDADDVLAGVLGGEAPARRGPGERVDRQAGQCGQRERAARGRVAHDGQAAGEGQRDVPRLRERAVGATPERLHGGLAVRGGGEARQPGGRPPLGVGARAARLEGGQAPDSVGGAHRRQIFPGSSFV